MKFWQEPTYKLEAQRKWRQENREQSNALRRDWRIQNPEKTMLAAAKKAARVKNVPFDLTAADIVIPFACPVLGVPLYRGEGIRTECSPSLDRIKPALGYVRGNVMVISWRANRIKADATFEELAAVADFYRRLEAN